MGLRVAIVIVLAGAATAVATTSGRDRSAATATGGPSATTARVPRAAVVRSRAARIDAGTRATVLRVRRLGRFVVTCGEDRRSAVEFVADRLLPSADVVARGARGVRARMVHPERRWAAWPRPAPVVAETWQIAPFAAAQVRVSEVHVAARRLPDGEAFGCAASALAVIGPDQGPTRTEGRR